MLRRKLLCFHVCLAITRVDGIISGAKVAPSLRNRVINSHVSDIFSHHHCETGIEMEINVAMEEPRAGIVGSETNSDIVTAFTSVDHITNNGVVIVVNAASRTTNDSEVVTMQMERMRSGSNSTWHTDLIHAVGAKRDDASGGEKILSVLLATENLKKDGDGGRDESCVVDEECTASEVEHEVDMVNVRTSWCVAAGNTRVDERMEGRLDERVRRWGRRGRSRVFHRCTSIAEDGRVYSAEEGSVCTIRLGSDPVVTDRLVGHEHERISLSSEDLDLVGLHRLRVDSVGFNDSHPMIIDGEQVVRIAGDTDKTEAISFVTLNRDDGQVSLSGIGELTTMAVD